MAQRRNTILINPVLVQHALACLSLWSRVRFVTLANIRAFSGNNLKRLAEKNLFSSLSMRLTGYGPATANFHIRQYREDHEEMKLMPWRKFKKLRESGFKCHHVLGSRLCKAALLLVQCDISFPLISRDLGHYDLESHQS